jgi:hypothetical protein
VTFNHDRVSYLYIICAAIFDVENFKITLNHVPFIDPIDSSDDIVFGWPLADDDDSISRGTYCIVFDRDGGNFNAILPSISDSFRSFSRVIKNQRTDKEYTLYTIKIDKHAASHIILRNPGRVK